jgi:hypothetical protein
MLTKLFEIGRQVFNLARDTQQNTSDIKAIQEQVRDLSVSVKLLAVEMERLKENERNERDKLILRLKTVLLRFEHRLPPATGPDDRLIS